MWRNCIWLLLAALLVACGRDEPATTPAGDVADVHAPVSVVEWPLPSLRPGTHSPSLTATHDGRLLLSWVNSQRGRRHAFQFSAYDLARQRWRGAPLTIAVGNSLFVNWLDPPRMHASRDGALWAQWLQTTGQGRAPDVMFSRSRDGGANWSEPNIPYAGQAGALHGHVALWPEGDRGLGMAWLDAREIDMDATASLRATGVDASGTPAGEAVLDARVNACDSISVALTARGPLLAYRGHSVDEARDVWVIRRERDDWTAPMRVHADAGRFYNCLMGTGTAVAAHGEAVVAVWLTSDDHQEKWSSNEQTWVIRMALSTDAGDTFAVPVEIAHGRQISPFAVALDDRQAWVLWASVDDEGVQSLWLSRRSPDLQEEYERREIARSKRPLPVMNYPHGMGVPRFALYQGIGYVVWTEEYETGTTLRGVKLLPAQSASPQ